MKYTYKLTSRPFSIGTQPEGFIRYIQGDQGDYGMLVYDTPLTSQQLDDYDLKDITIKLIRDEILELRKDRLSTFKDETKRERFSELKELMNEHYFKKILNDNNIERGLSITRNDKNVLISKGFEDNFRITTFDKDFKPYHHAEYKSIEKLAEEVKERYLLDELLVL